MDPNNIPTEFLEAVQMKLWLRLETDEEDPRLRLAIVDPHSIDRQRGTLWAYVVKNLPAEGMIPIIASNRDFHLSKIVRWTVAPNEFNLTQQKIPEKVFRDFEGHPLQKALIEIDTSLRLGWLIASRSPDFDPAPFIEKDRRLGEIAEELKKWNLP